MAGVLKEEALLKEYWLEPANRRVEPFELSVTDMKGEVLERTVYSARAGVEIRASAGRRHGVLIDFGREVGGFPRITFGTGKCLRVYAQAVESIEHLTSPLIAVTLSKADPTLYCHGFRADPERQVDLPHCGGFRYIWLYPGFAGRVTLSEAWVDYTPHFDDVDEYGYFLCSDDRLNRAWYAGLHTIEMCTVDPELGGIEANKSIGEGKRVLVDGAKRDRLIWAGDISPMSAAVYTSSNCVDAVKNSLLSLAGYQQKNGYIPACSPGPLPARFAGAFFADYVAWWIVSLYQYYVHTGDRNLVRELFPVVKRALHYLHSQCRGGLLRQTPFNMMEWCYTVLRLGKVAYSNVMYYWALNSASFLAHEVGEEQVSIGYVSRGFRLGEAIERELFDTSSGLLVDSTADRGRIPQDANSLVIVSGMMGEPAVRERILDYMRENLWEQWGSTNVDIPYYRLTPGLEPHNRRVIPFMNNFECLARFMSDDNEGAMELINRCWVNMVEKEPNTTFWEWVGRDGGVDNHLTSLCHGWSCGVVPLLSKYVLGIRPGVSGYKTFRFDPRPVGLEWVEGRVPVPGGFIEARAEYPRKGGPVLRVRAPGGMKLLDSRRKVDDASA